MGYFCLHRLITCLNLSPLLRVDLRNRIAQYTLQERQDPGPSPQTYFDVAGQSASVVMTLTAGETVNMINSLNGSTVCKFENNVDGAYTINGGVGALAAWITMYRIA